MSSRQTSLVSCFKRKEKKEESNNNPTKKSKLNDSTTNMIHNNSNNILNDNLNNILIDNSNNRQVLADTEPSCDKQSNISENCSSSATITTTTNDTRKGTYQKWYADTYKWLVYEPNKGGFCRICCDYWKPTTPFYAEMNPKIRDAFSTRPFINWKNAPGQNRRLARHQQSTYHILAVQNLSYRQQGGLVAQQLFKVSEVERQDNRQRFGDLLDVAYFLFKQELPHTTLYAPLFELLSKIEDSKKVSTFFDKYQNNAAYDSTTTVTEILQCTSEVIDEPVLKRIRQSRFISIMADEGTDINHHQNLSICIHYCNQDTGKCILTLH